MNAVDVPVTVDVSAPLFLGYTLSESRTIQKEDYVKVTFNNLIRLDNTEVAPKGILVQSTGEVVVIAVNRETYTNDAFLAIPEPALGTKYYAVSYFPTWYPSQFVVIGTEDNTEVKITLSTNPNADVVQFDNTTYEPGDTILISIDKFDSVQIQSKGDLTGSLIGTDKPVGFLSGNKRTNIGNGTRSSDHLVEYLTPVNKWGSKFASVPIPGRKVGDFYKVVASSTNTILTVKCSDRFGNRMNYEKTLHNSGDFVHLHITFEKYCSFLSNKAVMVVQFVHSQDANDHTDKHDPAMMLITPVEQYESEYRFNTPRFTWGTYQNFFLFVVKSDQRSGIRVDNDVLPSSTEFVDIPGTDLVGGYVEVSDGYHAVYHISPIVVFGGYLYGRARFETYGIPAGTRMANVNEPCSRSTTIAGDVVDNDCDGFIDEELPNALDDDGDGEIDEDCAVPTSPIDGNWASWSGWGTCSITCTSDINPSGQSVRIRTCSEPTPKYDGKTCSGNGEEYLTCTPDRCPPVNGSWSDWSPWSDCTGCVSSFTPTIGSLTRVRTCTNPSPAFGGLECPADDLSEESDTCSCPIDGKWSNWEPWNHCSMTCNPYTGSDLIITGTHTRSRSCSDPFPQHGGIPCDGNYRDTESCQNNTSCPGSTDGIWATWGSWTECVRIRQRTCNNPAPYGTGIECMGENNQTTNCSSEAGPTEAAPTVPPTQCSCPVPTATNVTPSFPSPPPPEELAKILQDLNIQLRRNKKETSRYKRSLVSASDPRGSSKAMGLLMISIIVIGLLGFMLMDLDRLCRFLREREPVGVI
ncbi:uncharacterized protein LOC117341916 [Pecten maximus]|uniref:uncharacterized protein LOC117341916 n=1 Tax=Pecten maximus TaxID=6579 RepID=UPI0014584E05|nr:uncharacterized protein LOC117341916 [Pecten maximus]